MIWGAGTYAHCWWECKLYSSFVENSKMVPYKSTNRISYDSTNAVLDIYTKEIKSVSQRDIYSPKFTATFFVTALIHNQLPVTNKCAMPEVTLDKWEIFNSQNNCRRLLAP